MTTWIMWQVVVSVVVIAIQVVVITHPTWLRELTLQDRQDNAANFAVDSPCFYRYSLCAMVFVTAIIAAVLALQFFDWLIVAGVLVQVPFTLMLKLRWLDRDIT